MMNLQSTGLEGLPTLTLNKLSLYQWFKKNKGIERRTIDQPLLSEDDKQARLQHAAFIQDLHQQGKVICYLNVKWFYIYSRRKISKHLP